MTTKQITNSHGTKFQPKIRRIHRHYSRRMKRKGQSNSVIHVTIQSLSNQTLTNKSSHNLINNNVSSSDGHVSHSPVNSQEKDGSFQRNTNDHKSIHRNSLKTVLHTSSLSKVDSLEDINRDNYFCIQTIGVKSNRQGSTINHHKNPKKKKRRIKRRVFWLIIGSVLALLTLATAATAITLRMIITKPTSETTQTTTAPLINPCLNGNYWNITGIIYAGNGVAGNALNQLSGPTGIFIKSDDTLYISDSGNWRIMSYLPNAASGTLVAGTGTSGTALNQFSSNIRYNYVDENQNIYISDTYNNRIVRWASGGSTGVIVGGNGTSGGSLNQMAYPYGVWVDSTSNVFVTELSNSRVTKWAAGATSAVVVAGITGSSGSTTNQLSLPTGIFYDEANQNLYIVNNGGAATVMKWRVGDSNGTIVAGLAGSSGSNASQLNNPSGITLDQWKNIYVNDRSNSRIQLFCNGNSTGITIAGSGTGGSNLSAPYDVRLDSQYNLYVVENGAHRVTKFAKL